VEIAPLGKMPLYEKIMVIVDGHDKIPYKKIVRLICEKRKQIRVIE